AKDLVACFLPSPRLRSRCGYRATPADGGAFGLRETDRASTSGYVFAVLERDTVYVPIDPSARSRPPPLSSPLRMTQNRAGLRGDRGLSIRHQQMTDVNLCLRECLVRREAIAR